jgi:hypothetical protein
VWVLLLCAVLASACARPQIQTSGQSGFGGARSYALEQAVDRAGPAGAAPAVVRERIEALIEQALDRRGLRRVDSADTPDLVARYWLEAVDPDGERTPYQHYYQTGGGAPYTDYPERTLTVDLVPTAGNAVWHARITRLEAPSPTRLSRGVEAGLTQALEALPGD